jgi:hypothetical protein
MNEEARAEWLAVAWHTVGHLPADLLAIGCKKAREVCDHPSKIVPAILAETRDLLERRRDHVRASYTPPARQLPPPDVCTPEAAAAILAEMGLSSAAEQTVKRYLGAPRRPTRADYIAMGVYPADLTTSTSNE